jgi:serine/threonine-protein kinase HipA
MHQFIKTYLWDEPLGIISWNKETQNVQFEFIPSFIHLGIEPSPILFPMEKFRQKSEIFSYGATGIKSKEIPPIFMDNLPGKYAKDLLRYALHNSPKTPESLSHLSYLSLLGNRGFGALSYEPSGYPELNKTEAVDIDQIVRYAHSLYNNTGMLLSERRVRELLRSGLFTCGSWPKALIAINDFTGEVISGQGEVPEGFEGWILKMDGINNAEFALHEEYAYYQKACECGIKMSPCRLLKDGHRTHLLCKRFDRTGNKKIHLQSFTALRDKLDDSYEAAFRCMRQLCLPYPDIEQLYKRLVFNVLIGNCKDYSSKIIFTYTQEKVWHLAPAFNLKPTKDKKNHELSLGGKTSEISEKDLLQLGKLLNIKQAKAILKICKEVC